jgi:hypothetical protein
MRPWLAVGVMGIASAAAVAGRAAPAVEIRGAAARVTIIPRAQATIDATLVHADARLPIRIRRVGDRLYVTGDVGRQIRSCAVAGGARGVSVWGRGMIAYDQLPQLVIRAPMAVRIIAGEAVFGEIGKSASVDFTNLGCGDWVIADVQGRLRLNQAGSGALRTGSAGSSDLSVAATGGVSTGDIRGGLKAVSSGSGNIAVAQVSGPVDARVAGSGDIDLAGGAVGAMTVSIAGSGAVRLRGTAQSLKVSIAGSGDVTVTRVVGTVSKQVFGPGAVRVGR